MANSRDDFSSSTKELLARRVGYRCSNPNCRKSTSGANTDPEKAINIGVAAHITAAAKGGPRYSESMTSDERKSFSNGIWLCQSCSKLIDTDENRYTIDVLNQWKSDAENFATLKLETSSEVENVLQKKNRFCNDKKEEYIKIWNKELFLHSSKDENCITLADAFIMPDFKMYRQHERIKFTNNGSLDTTIDEFIKYDKATTMLITGVPGIGKTTITAWLANKYKNNEKLVILRFRDWECEDLEKGLLKAIYDKLECEKSALDDLILIIDGFDEIKALYKRKDILNRFFSAINDLEHFKCIITSRPTYIDTTYFDSVIELQ